MSTQSTLPKLTLFTATLVQDSALSVSGFNGENTVDRPFSIVDRVPVLSGRGLKGAAVAMARRFFDPLPRSISETAEQTTALNRSVWEFSNARLERTPESQPQLRAGVGILQKTGARAGGVLYDSTVMPAALAGPLSFVWIGPGQERRLKRPKEYLATSFNTTGLRDAAGLAGVLLEALAGATSPISKPTDSTILLTKNGSPPGARNFLSRLGRYQPKRQPARGVSAL